MVRFIRSLFAWRTVSVVGVWRYLENDITGQRAAERAFTGGFSPLAFDWLDGGWSGRHPKINGYPAWRSAEGQLSGRYVGAPGATYDDRSNPLCP